jgi:four helix bundle protein
MIENLQIYIKSLNLVKEIYLLISQNNSLSRDYSLSDQIKRAAVSVATNISEGYCQTKKHCKSYLKISSGSANETITLLQIINLVYRIDTSKLQNEYKILAKQISSFSSSFH